MSRPHFSVKLPSQPFLETSKLMIALSVNVNKIATLRNSRGGQVPNVVHVAQDALRFGANGITIHPRPDGRHIRRQDVVDLSAMIKDFNSTHEGHREFNIEGYPTEDFLQLVEHIGPDQVTLVPDPPEVLTSNAGWKVVAHAEFLNQVCQRLQAKKMRVSLFVDPFDVDAQFVQAIAKTQALRAELYTEMFASAFATPTQISVTKVYAQAAQLLRAAGLGLNAGHDLSLQNVSWLRQQLPEIEEVSIGHALIAESLYLGLEETIRRYLKQLQG